jgi:hypothetical protein
MVIHGFHSLAAAGITSLVAAAAPIAAAGAQAKGFELAAGSARIVIGVDQGGVRLAFAERQCAKICPFLAMGFAAMPQDQKPARD